MCGEGDARDDLDAAPGSLAEPADIGLEHQRSDGDAAIDDRHLDDQRLGTRQFQEVHAAYVRHRARSG